MKKPLFAIITAAAAVFAFPSCTTVVDPTPMTTPAVTTAQQTETRTSQVDPYTGATTYKKTTTTSY